MGSKKYIVQLTRIKEFSAEEKVVYAESEEKAKETYLEMLAAGFLALEECSFDDDWYCEEEEE